jgi:GAF domain-containing protein
MVGSFVVVRGHVGMPSLQAGPSFQLWQDCKRSGLGDNGRMGIPDSERRSTMQPPPVPADEPERLAALWSTGLLDTPPADAFDRITLSVAELLHVPIAVISLVDEKRQWFLSRFGLEVTETPRDVSFCGHAVASRQELRVDDTWKDPRFSDNPLVTGEPYIRAYLGVPVFDDAGHALGTLCVLDRRARRFTPEERQILQRYARIVQHLIRR